MSLELGKEIFEAGILELQQEMMTKDVDSMAYYASKITELMYNFIKSATVEINTGIAVSTTGSATAQTGSTTTKGTGILK